MRRAYRIALVGLLVVATLAQSPLVAVADEGSAFLMESEVLLTVAMDPDVAAESLLVQGTSWPGDPHFYVLTLVNNTSWRIGAMRVLDRYCPDDPSQPEVHHDWFPGVLDPGDATTVVFQFPDGSIEGACHQLEISIGDGLGTVLMDCSPSGATTVWQVVLTGEMEDFLAQPALTLEGPEGGSKLGLHVTQNSSEAIMGFVREATPEVVVAVGDLGWLAAVKEASPDTVTIARLDQGDQSMEGDPRARARDYVAQNEGTYLVHPYVDYWLGWNEPVIDNVEDMIWYASFESERVVVMSELGLDAAIGNFSVGTPEPYEIEHFLPAVAAAKEHGGILALHEYSAPTMRSGVGSGVPGLVVNDEYGALTLRYRIWYDHYLKAHDLVIPLVITEAGIDGGVLAPQGLELGGWRDFVKDEYLGADLEQAANAYLDQLSWYDDQLRRDPYVIGFAAFNAGDAGGDWASFDVTDLLSDLAWLANGK